MIKTFPPTTLVVRNAPILYRKDIKMYSPTKITMSGYGMLQFVWNDHSPRIIIIF